MKTIAILLSFALLTASLSAKESVLSGTVMGIRPSETQKAFDHDPSTYYEGEHPWNYSYVRNWVGLDLGEKHVITAVSLTPANGHADDCRLAVAQGANNPDFSDALPLTVFKDEISGGYAFNEVEVTRAFRYVRLMATGSAGYFAEVEFYGAPGDGDDSKFYQLTNLPLVVVNTPGDAQIMSKDDKHPGSYVAIVSEEGGSILEDGQAQLKGRGNGSWTFPKKPMQIKFNKKQQPLDAPAKAKKWTLINNYGDRTLMRNKVAFEMSRMAGMPYTPYCTFVDVIYNGSYEGAYQLCDQVEVNPGRVEITEMEDGDTDGDALTGGYFIEIDAYAYSEASMFTSDKSVPVTIKSPDEDIIVKEQARYIADFYNKFENAVFSKNYTDPEEGYRKYLDVESFLRYFILSELNGNIDAWWSVYMYKDRNDERLHVGPIWDIDLGFQNVGDSYRVYDVDKLTDWIYNCPKASLASMVLGSMLDRIVKYDADARDMMSDLWSDMRYNRGFSAEYFAELIDGYARELEESQRLNFLRWPILNMSVQKEQHPFGSYEGEVDNIRSYVMKRVPRLDEFIGLKEQVAIDGISELDSSTSEALFDLQGRRVDASTALSPGIYLRHCGAQAEKIIVR